MIDDNCYMISEHAFCKLQKIGKDVENICEYFNKKKMKINRKSIRIFSSPTETYCTVSYMIQTDNNGITYIFSDLYFFISQLQPHIICQPSASPAVR